MTSFSTVISALGEPSSRIHIPKQSGSAFRMSSGSYLRVIDPEGEQVADLVAFANSDFSIRLSTDQTREVARSLWISTGDRLLAPHGEQLLTIVADDVGRHDLLFPWCRPEMYQRIYGVQSHPNCYDNLCGALEPFGIVPDELPMPFNIFQNVEIRPDGKMSVLRPLSKPGDSILLRAERDLIVGVSACSSDRSACNGYNPTAIDLESYSSTGATP